MIARDSEGGEGSTRDVEFHRRGQLNANNNEVLDTISISRSI